MRIAIITQELVRQRYLGFADRWYRGECDRYHRLAVDLAADPDALQFLANHVGGTQPNLFFAAVQYLTGSQGMPSNYPELRRLMNRRSKDIAALLAARRNQTNEIGRCALLLPALPAGPLALIEVGASAGLCLLLDRLRYEYPSAGTGDPNSPVLLRCDVTGPAPIPPCIPRVAWRGGLDLHPIDVNDPDAVRWLEACVWHGDEARRKRLKAAIELARTDPPPVYRGDLVDDLARLVEQAPMDALLVVFHSAALTYVSPPRRRQFARILGSAAKRRVIVWLSNELEGIMHDLCTEGSAAGAPVRFLLQRTVFSRGAADRELLAITHPHGLKMTWISQSGPARG